MITRAALFAIRHPALTELALFGASWFVASVACLDWFVWGVRECDREAQEAHDANQ